MAGIIHQEGLQALLEYLNKAQTPGATLYMGTCEDASIAANASLAGLTENAGTGYARVAVTANGTDLVSATDGANGWKLTSKVCRFTAGAAWNIQKHIFLATSSDDSGKLVASAALNGGAGYELTLAGQYFEASLVLTLAQP